MTRWSRVAVTISAAVLTCVLSAGSAFAEFPYARPGADTKDFTDLYLTGQVPSDVCGDDNEFKYSASPDPSNTAINNSPVELGGVRGGHLVDKMPPGPDCDDPPLHASQRPTAFKLTTGRPDVTIAVLDSGIEWNNEGAMEDLRRKVHLNTAELPKPRGCSRHDCNGDRVVNVDDYAADPRVDLDDPRRVGPPGVLTPQDLLIAFSDGGDDDRNGFVDDIAGWDFLDDDNDAFDDVQYGHGTGEALGSVAEAENGGNVGSCPNCTFIPLRVGDSFVADINRFAAAVLYATDNEALVVQEALGTLNNSRLAREAVEYAYRHGVTVIASAADEAAQHNNWPSSLPHVIVVNSVTTSRLEDEQPNPTSYLAFNGCTNFNPKITLAIPSTSCSSDATGVGSGMAGIVYSAALTAREHGVLRAHPRSGCRLVGGDPCPITPNEVRQLMASATVGGRTQVDDVNFAGTPPGSGSEPSCSPVPTPKCTDPNFLLQRQVDANRLPPVPASQSYPARKGHDQFYGYGRVNMHKATAALLSDPRDPRPASLPPEAEITAPEWYAQVDPARSALRVEGEVFARGSAYRCEVLVAPGQYPNNARVDDVPPGDFAPVRNGWCNGERRTSRHSGPVAVLDVARLRSRFPPGTRFGGPEPAPNAANGNGRPNAAPHSFTVQLVVSTERGGHELTGEDRRIAYLHRDRDMLEGFPRTVSGRAITGDGESSPAFADLDADNENELIYASTDGFVHALRRDGSELSGWPVRGDVPEFVFRHRGAPAFASGGVGSDLGGAMLSSVAVGDTDRNGALEVYVADLEGKVYGWDRRGRRIFTEGSNPDYSGEPLRAFGNVRYDPAGQSEFRRTQPGFVGSPVLADLDLDGDEELIAASMDRHVYAWSTGDRRPRTPGGATPVRGFPVLIVDPAKVTSIDRRTHAVTFAEDAGSRQQGAIIDTPAVADIAGDARPEIVIGTNEEYEEQFNAGNLTTGSFAAVAQLGELVDALDLLSMGNGRVHAIGPEGDRDGNPDPSDALLPGWPFALGILETELLPIVGEGVNGGPVVAPLTCPAGGEGPKIGIIANNGPAYVLNPDGTSCYGDDPTSGRPNALESDVSAGALEHDRPVVPALGLPAFGDLGGPEPSFLAPAAGLKRALDVAAPEYQAGQDFVGAWDTLTGQFRPGFPVTVNDLQFLTGPAVGNIDATPTEEVVAGTASMDLSAHSALGLPVPGWPKLSTDWTVATPLIGSFGSFDVYPGPRKVVIGLTRSGYINGYRTAAHACAPASWPRFRHDNANSGDYRRDATLPGRPYAARGEGGRLEFAAPGDDLLCGNADRYEIVTSKEPITASSFRRARPLGGAPEPAAAGTEQAYELPRSPDRFVAIRAVDEQGNVSAPTVIDLAP